MPQQRQHRRVLQGAPQRSGGRRGIPSEPPSIGIIPFCRFPQKHHMHPAGFYVPGGSLPRTKSSSLSVPEDPTAPNGGARSDLQHLPLRSGTHARALCARGRRGAPHHAHGHRTLRCRVGRAADPPTPSLVHPSVGRQQKTLWGMSAPYISAHSPEGGGGMGTTSPL